MSWFGIAKVSRDLCLRRTDYKGHVQVQCVEGCGICYHPACWRKFKSDCVISTDRDFLGSTCTTPDCGGIIKTVSVHDTGGLKIKVRREWKLRGYVGREENRSESRRNDRGCEREQG